MNIEIKTKFEIGDSVYGFADGELHNLEINRIEVSLARYGSNNPINNIQIVYLATTTDAENNYQHRFKECNLFTEDELKNYVDKYFERIRY